MNSPGPKNLPNESSSPSGNQEQEASYIDRRALVGRHNVVRTHLDRDNPLQVGNGEFAFNVDITGLQSIVPFNTLAQWAWHSAPLPDEKQPDDYPWVDWDHSGGAKPYCSRVDINDPMFVWRFTNPHKINLGRIALRLLGSESSIKEEDIKNARQELDLWTGQITSLFEINGKPVRVETVCDPDHEMVAVRVVSPLLKSGEMGVEVSFPGAGKHAFEWVPVDRLIGDWTPGSSEHVTIARQRDGNHVDFARFLDESEYHVSLCWETEETIFKAQGAHRFTLSPTPDISEVLAFTVAFSSDSISDDLPRVAETVQNSARFWDSFWSNGGAVDLSNSRDSRWKELERRIVLSQYLMAVNVAGSLPPQESGLLLNNWYGKFHMEMTWWHAAHFALWNRTELFRNTLCWYQTLLPEARKIAERQGYPGVRWPKMVGPEGRESPNDVNPLLIWQQPHPIFFAELEWRANPTDDTLERWKEIVSETGAFMAAFPVWDEDRSYYDLAPPLCTVSRTRTETRVLNPAFETHYWRFGLAVAQQWRERLVWSGTRLGQCAGTVSTASEAGWCVLNGREVCPIRILHITGNILHWLAVSACFPVTALTKYYVSNALGYFGDVADGSGVGVGLPVARNVRGRANEPQRAMNTYCTFPRISVRRQRRDRRMVRGVLPIERGTPIRGRYALRRVG
jgi:hypothetical protein